MDDQFGGAKESVFAGREGSSASVRVAARDCNAEPFECLHAWKTSTRLRRIMVGRLRPFTTPTLLPSSSRIGPCSICSSKCAANGLLRYDAGVEPRKPILSSSCFMVFLFPSWPGVTSAKFHAVSRGTASAQTPDETAIMGKRAPSSLEVGVSVSVPHHVPLSRIFLPTHFVQFTTPILPSV